MRKFQEKRPKFNCFPFRGIFFAPGPFYMKFSVFFRLLFSRLLRGLITGTIRSNPEFVSPEVVKGYPLTLATDLWSVGTLAYVL